LKQQPDFLQFRPYRAIVAPKLRPQSERDNLSYGVKKQDRFRPLSRPQRSQNRNGGFIAAIVLIVAALLIFLALHFWLRLV